MPYLEAGGGMPAAVGCGIVTYAAVAGGGTAAYAVCGIAATGGGMAHWGDAAGIAHCGGPMYPGCGAAMWALLATSWRRAAISRRMANESSQAVCALALFAIDMLPIVLVKLMMDALSSSSVGGS